MEKLRKAILCEGIWKTDFHNEELKKRLSEIPQLEFIPYFLLNGDISSNDIFFLSNLGYWEEMDFEGWKRLLINIQHKGLGVYSFFVITYKYLKINLIPFFKDLVSEYEDLKISSLKRFYDNPHILQHDDEADRLIKKYNLDSGGLDRIRRKLLSQGALPAEKIVPRKKLQVGYSVINPPIGWDKWAKELF